MPACKPPQQLGSRRRPAHQSRPPEPDTLCPCSRPARWRVPQACTRGRRRAASSKVSYLSFATASV
eukprot:1825326-Alexandrium_andersonii.AAC.1